MLKSRLLGRPASVPGFLADPTYSCCLLGLRYVYFMCTKGLVNASNPPLAIRIFNFQVPPPTVGHILLPTPQDFFGLFLYVIVYCIYIKYGHRTHE